MPVRGIILILQFVVVVTLLSHCAPMPQTKIEAQQPNHQAIEENYGDERINSLWDQTVRKLLQDDLWIEKYAYDAGHNLMVPMHAAFRLDNTSWQEQFYHHFMDFSNNLHDYSLEPENTRLTRLHYYYLVSQYIKLATIAEKNEWIPDDLPDFIITEIGNLWTDYTASQYARKPFFGMKHRVDWKLNSFDVERSYYRAIIDEELFSFAIASDMLYYLNHTGTNHEDIETLNEMVEMASVVFNTEGQFTIDGGWLFQPGVWRDHPDYAYAGYDNKYSVIKDDLIKVDGIAMDTSHSHRFPLWLDSLTDSFPEESETRSALKKISNGLDFQFRNHVLVTPTDDFQGYRTTNFMNGHNGVYRWAYTTTKENNGYGPYELSGTLMLGWWIFLDTPAIKEVFNDMSHYFPLEENVIQTYVGPNTTRERHYIMSEPGIFTNGISELTILLASLL